MRSLLILVFVLSSAHLMSQDETLNKEKWKQLKDEVEYVQASAKKSKEPKGEQDGRGNQDDYVDESGGSVLNLGPLIQIVIIILFILFIAALLYTIFSNVSLKQGTKRIENAPNDAIVSIEENFSKNNLERWLKYAIEQNDHYLILRIRFLMVLKSLENKKLILWKKDKTNWHYIQELGSHHFQNPFKELVFEFDHVWYGEKKYGEADLVEKIGRFESFQKMVEE